MKIFPGFVKLVKIDTQSPISRPLYWSLCLSSREFHIPEYCWHIIVSLTNLDSQALQPLHDL